MKFDSLEDKSIRKQMNVKRKASEMYPVIKLYSDTAVY